VTRVPNQGQSTAQHIPEACQTLTSLQSYPHPPSFVLRYNLPPSGAALLLALSSRSPLFFSPPVSSSISSAAAG